MKKIGLLLGSFDPIHIAHINIASCVLNAGLCDEVLFVVAKHNPWKENDPVPFDIRCEMVRESISPIDGASVCELEKDIEPPVYSYKVLTKIREEHPDDELYLISGTDTFNHIPAWKNWEIDIKPYFKYIVASRYVPNDLEKGEAYRVDTFGSAIGQVDEIVTTTLDVSSTVVRNMVANGLNPFPLVTKEVLNIINRHNLYKK